MLLYRYQGSGIFYSIGRAKHMYLRLMISFCVITAALGCGVILASESESENAFHQKNAVPDRFRGSTESQILWVLVDQLVDINSAQYFGSNWYPAHHIAGLIDECIDQINVANRLSGVNIDGNVPAIKIFMNGLRDYDNGDVVRMRTTLGAINDLLRIDDKEWWYEPSKPFKKFLIIWLQEISKRMDEFNNDNETITRVQPQPSAKVYTAPWPLEGTQVIEVLRQLIEPPKWMKRPAVDPVNACTSNSSLPVPVTQRQDRGMPARDMSAVPGNVPRIDELPVPPVIPAQEGVFPQARNTYVSILQQQVVITSSAMVLMYLWDKKCTWWDNREKGGYMRLPMPKRPISGHRSGGLLLVMPAIAVPSMTPVRQ